MKKEDLLNAVQHMPKPVKPKIPKAAVAGFIAGGVVVAAAASAIGYFFLKKKEITLHLCCDIADHDDEECRFEEEASSPVAKKSEKDAKKPSESPLGAFADTFGDINDEDDEDTPAVKPAERGEEAEK